MDLTKIGKFICDCRKNKDLTQEQLAEKLNISNRAISKWERGICLPDASIMISLCEILDINVNELLIGEKIKSKDYNKKTDELLIEMAKQEEIKNKKIIFNTFVLEFTTIIFYIATVLLASLAFEEGAILGAIVCVSTIILVVTCYYGIKLEVDTGYYECKNCHHRFIPKNYLTAMFAPHINTTRHLRCPECNKKSWCKKVYKK